MDSVRLDKWLWAARFFKTRALASEAIVRGKVLVNGNRSKSSRHIHINDELQIRKGPYEWQVSVEGLSENRGPARDAVKLYSESETSISARKKLSKALQLDRLSRPTINKRPDKKERRKLVSFKKLVDR
jgi:ribosome-associated heat shock protein Hsp15